MVLKTFKDILKCSFKFKATKATHGPSIQEPMTTKYLDRSGNTSNTTGSTKSFGTECIEESSKQVGDINDPVEVVKEFVSCFNERRLQDASEKLIKEDMNCEFYDVSGQELLCEMRWNLLFEEGEKLFLAFPDFRIIAKVINEGSSSSPSQQQQDDDTPSVVKMLLVSCGTHTGADYGFGPYPPIGPSGRKVVNDPEEVHFYLEGNKICKIVIYPTGEKTGLQGFYAGPGGFPI